MNNKKGATIVLTTGTNVDKPNGFKITLLFLSLTIIVENIFCTKAYTITIIAEKT